MANLNVLCRDAALGYLEYRRIQDRYYGGDIDENSIIAEVRDARDAFSYAFNSLLIAWCDTLVDEIMGDSMDEIPDEIRSEASKMTYSAVATKILNTSGYDDLAHGFMVAALCKTSLASLREHAMFPELYK